MLAAAANAYANLTILCFLFSEALFATSVAASVSILGHATVAAPKLRHAANLSTLCFLFSEALFATSVAASVSMPLSAAIMPASCCSPTSLTAFAR